MTIQIFLSATRTWTLRSPLLRSWFSQTSAVDVVEETPGQCLQLTSLCLPRIWLARLSEPRRLSGAYPSFCVRQRHFTFLCFVPLLTKTLQTYGIWPAVCTTQIVVQRHEFANQTYPCLPSPLCVTKCSQSTTLVDREMAMPAMNRPSLPNLPFSIGKF